MLWYLPDRYILPNISAVGRLPHYQRKASSQSVFRQSIRYGLNASRTFIYTTYSHLLEKLLMTLLQISMT